MIDSLTPFNIIYSIIKEQELKNNYYIRQKPVFISHTPSILNSGATIENMLIIPKLFKYLMLFPLTQLFPDEIIVNDFHSMGFVVLGKAFSGDCGPPLLLKCTPVCKKHHIVHCVVFCADLCIHTSLHFLNL